jgi:hypothetical protein
MSIFTKIKDWFVAQAVMIEEFLTPYEHDFLQRASALASQIEHNLGADGLDLAKTLLVEALEAVGSGNFGEAIAAAAPKLLATLTGDITAEVKNAAYGALAIAQAELQAVSQPIPATTPSPEPAPATAA